MLVAGSNFGHANHDATPFACLHGQGSTAQARVRHAQHFLGAYLQLQQVLFCLKKVRKKLHAGMIKCAGSPFAHVGENQEIKRRLRHFVPDVRGRCTKVIATLV